jgi:hypothetical protein
MRIFRIRVLVEGILVGSASRFLVLVTICDSDRMMRCSRVRRRVYASYSVRSGRQRGLSFRQRPEHGFDIQALSYFRIIVFI